MIITESLILNIIIVVGGGILSLIGYLIKKNVDELKNTVKDNESRLVNLKEELMEYRVEFEKELASKLAIIEFREWVSIHKDEHNTILDKIESKLDNVYSDVIFIKARLKGGFNNETNS